MAKSKWKRKISQFLAVPLVKLIFFVIWRTCRVKKIIGAEHFDNLQNTGKPFIPCYWHQRHIFCAYYVLHKMKQGLKLGFLISPSADGEIVAQVVKDWGATPIRGSSTRTGAKAMRDMYETITKHRISPVTTSDGPTGPPHVFKQGAVMLSQLTQAPMLPMAYAASRAWQLRSWDRFLIPKPFSRIVIAVGSPRQAAKGVKLDELEPIRLDMEQALNQLIKDAEQALADSSDNGSNT